MCLQWRLILILNIHTNTYKYRQRSEDAANVIRSNKKHAKCVSSDGEFWSSRTLQKSHHLRWARLGIDPTVSRSWQTCESNEATLSSTTHIHRKHTVRRCTGRGRWIVVGTTSAHWVRRPWSSDASFQVKSWKPCCKNKSYPVQNTK